MNGVLCVIRTRGSTAYSAFMRLCVGALGCPASYASGFAGLYKPVGGDCHCQYDMHIRVRQAWIVAFAKPFK